MICLLLLFCGPVHAGQGVQAAGVADIGQTLRDEFDEKNPVVAHVEVALGVGGELRFTAALGREEAEGDQLALPQVKTASGVGVAEAVGGQPAVDVPGLLPGRLKRFRFVFLLSTFTASLESLKREALKAFQCVSTVKAVMENTGKAAGDALLRSA